MITVEVPARITVACEHNQFLAGWFPVIERGNRVGELLADQFRRGVLLREVVQGHETDVIGNLIEGIQHPNVIRGVSLLLRQHFDVSANTAPRAAQQQRRGIHLRLDDEIDGLVEIQAGIFFQVHQDEGLFRTVDVLVTRRFQGNSPHFSLAPLFS